MFLCSEGIRIVKIRRIATEALGFGVRGGLYVLLRTVQHIFFNYLSWLMVFNFSQLKLVFFSIFFFVLICLIYLMILSILPFCPVCTVCFSLFSFLLSHFTFFSPNYIVYLWFFTPLLNLVGFLCRFLFLLFLFTFLLYLFQYLAQSWFSYSFQFISIFNSIHFNIQCNSFQ